MKLSKMSLSALALTVRANRRSCVRAGGAADASCRSQAAGYAAANDPAPNAAAAATPQPPAPFPRVRRSRS